MSFEFRTAETQRQAPHALQQPSSGPTARPLREMRASHRDDLLALHRLAGNRAVGLVVQRTLDANGTIVESAEQLGLPAGQQPSGAVLALLQRPETYYVPDDGSADFTAPTIRALTENKYLLGEEHGDGTWEARTRPWARIAKMRERLKGFAGETPEEANAIQAAGVMPASQELPLEDLHAFTLTRVLMTQQYLGRYDDVKRLGDGRAQLTNAIKDLTAALGDYAQVGLAWYRLGGHQVPPSGARARHFMEVAFARASKPEWTVLFNVATGARNVESLTTPEVTALRAMLEQVATQLMELLDTRPLSGGLFGWFASKQGADPIPNRTAIQSLAGATGSAGRFQDAVAAGNPVREAAMVRNIKAAPAPLLVQVGDLHVDRVAAAVGADAVPVKKGVDFDHVITRTG